MTCVCALCVQEFSVMSYTLLLSMIEYKTLVLRGDYAGANEILPQIPMARLPSSCLLCLLTPTMLLEAGTGVLCFAHETKRWYFRA